MGSSCPKCQAAIDEPVTNIVRDFSGDGTVFACGSRLFTDGSYRQSDACTIAVLEKENTRLQQQLADARLLARANGYWALYRSGEVIKDNTLVVNGSKPFTCEVDEHNLPILTDELRAALRKAVGE